MLFAEQAHDAACMVIGKAVCQLIAIRKPVTIGSITVMVRQLAAGEFDVADDLALSILRRV